MGRSVLSPINFAVHKRRADRGRIYLSYIQMLATTTILVKIFNVNSWWVYALGAVLVLGICYLLGYLDEKKRVLENEQNSYNKENPFVRQVIKDLDDIKKHLISNERTNNQIL